MMKFLQKIGASLQSPFLLLIRLYWGYHFVLTGFGKLTHLEETSAFFQSLNLPFPEMNAIAAGCTEMIGGALFFFGLFSRLISIPLMGVMIVAYLTAHFDSLVTLVIELDFNPFFAQAPFLFFFASLIVFLFGPGRFSVDRRLHLE